MEITFAPRGILQIDDCRIVYKNFAGVGTKFNREGDRNFAVVIPNCEYDPDVRAFEKGEISEEEIRTLSDVLTDQGWNVKVKPPREEGDDPFMYIPVKVKFNDRGPNVYLKSGENLRVLTEETVGMLDDVDILSVDLDIRPYDWEVQGKTGRTAYLQTIRVTQRIDRFAAEEFDNKVGF